ncbi:OB-fold domain-containing protein [Aeromicrobium sp.]|uniref:Zn-ribbon domain-containing OB-fold protein n=1 Tax=Aeromicrobium sp. TaxID=1871063 RepID=UPI0025B7CF2E|nr:OB-fold domain-containing protein [Aeromicrobium sp.]MCK5892605.1 OB-fold domain-containing protein [Aeromicrobium sp.]
MNRSGTIHAGGDLLSPGSAVRLNASFCRDCDRWEFPARTYCPTCDQEPTTGPLSPTAEVIGHSAVLHQPPGSLIDAPYPVALASFPEGVAVLGVVEDAEVGEVAIGDQVETVARLVGDSIEYAFRSRRSS